MTGQQNDALNLFLINSGWHTAQKSLLAHDASFRWYDRLEKETGETAVLMNAPIPMENPAQFVFVDELLEEIGLKVPHIFNRDLENGFLLLEDFGDDTFTRLINKGYDEKDLYIKAVQSLIHLQKNFNENKGLRQYDWDLMFFEASLLPLWYIKYVVKKELTDKDMAEYENIWKKLYEKISLVPNTLVLLDYHVDNLMITKTGECGLLDFQDARFGPVTYDLASLLEDARRPVPQEIQDEMLKLYFDELPEFNTKEYKEAYPLMAVQRHTKVIGIFVRLFVRDNKNRYLKHIPFVWSLLEKHLNSNPLLKDYKDWLDKHVPASIRCQVPFLEELPHETN